MVCVAHRKGTRAHTTREQPMDTGPWMQKEGVASNNNLQINIPEQAEQASCHHFYCIFIDHYTCYSCRKPIKIRWLYLEVPVPQSLENELLLNNAS